MKLFKYLNRKIYILLTVILLLFTFNNSAISHTVTSTPILPSEGEQVTFTSTFTFNGQMGNVIAYIDYGDGAGEQILDNNLVVPVIGNYSTTYTSTHVYLNKGIYIVSIRIADAGGVTSSGPNPATKTQQIKRGIKINRIQLYFDNNRPETTLKRNQKAPGLYAKINYSGSGYFKGYWEIDGVKKAYVFKNLSKGPSITLKYPAIPPLPTYRFGTHKVRFVVTNPAMNINFPYGIYFVTSNEAPDKPLEIKLLQPVEGESLAYNPLTFKWQQVGKSSIYFLSVFSKEKEERIFSAYTRQGEYELQPSTLKLYMKPGKEYLWNVTGYNDEKEVTAESIPSSFIFNQDTASLPEQAGQESD
jgi:hypothetical protein